MGNINHQIYLTAIKAALEAGKVIMDVYKTSFETEHKDDGSPITEADKRANDIICTALSDTGIDVISEESPKADYQFRKNKEYMWLVDPVDGTSEFVSRNGEFTVNIALVYHQRPVFGIVTAPASGQGWFGWVGAGARKADHLDILEKHANHLTMEKLFKMTREISTNKTHAEIPTVSVSRSHLSENTRMMAAALFGKSDNYKTIAKGSSLKFCMLAEGVTDYYLRADKINEWDTAAGHALVLAAGGEIVTWPDAGEELYNKESLVNSGFIVMGNPEWLSLFQGKFPSQKWV